MAHRPLPIAVVGAGRMGSVHLGALERSQAATAVAVVDPAPTARTAAAGAGLRWFPAVADLIAAGIAEAAIVAAPSPLHVELVGELAAGGLHVLCEKPCGLEPEDPLRAQAAADAAGVALAVGYWRRALPQLGALRERIAEGRLGQLALVACHQWDAEPPSPAFRRSSGGMAADMAVHELDQARWLTGEELGELRAWPAGRPDDPSDPDALVAGGCMSGGTALLITLGRRFPAGDSCWLEVTGADACERHDLMGGAAADDAFVAALVRQLEGFCAQVNGAERLGAGAQDAAAALDGARAIECSLAEQAARAFA